MHSLEIARCDRAIPLCNDPAVLASIRDQLDQKHGDDPDARGIWFMATTKRVRLLDVNRGSEALGSRAGDQAPPQL